MSSWWRIFSSSERRLMSQPVGIGRCPVIPTGAKRSGGTCSWAAADMTRSLDCAALRAASLGTTEKCGRPAKADDITPSSRPERSGVEGPALGLPPHDEVPRLRRPSGGFARDDGWEGRLGKVDDDRNNCRARGGRCAGGAGRAEAARAAHPVARQAPLAGRAFAPLAPDRGAAAALCLRRRGVLFRRRCRRGDRRPAPRRVRAPVGRDADGGRAHGRAHRRGHALHLGPAVHRELPRALPVQPAGPAAAAGRVVRRIVGRRAGHRSRRHRALRPHRLLRREPARLRFLQGLHGARRRSGSARSGRCSAPTRRWSPTMPRGWRGSRARTRSPSTCRAPRRSCRPSGWRAITPGARISCASAAPITAGGATCSPASAIPCRRTTPTPWPTCPSAPWPCCAPAGTSPACWSIRARRCIPTSGRPPIRPWSTAGRTGASIAPPIRPG